MPVWSPETRPWLYDATRSPSGPCFCCHKPKLRALVSGRDVRLTQLDYAQVSVKFAVRSGVWGQGMRTEGAAVAMHFLTLQRPHLLCSRCSRCTVDSHGPTGVSGSECGIAAHTHPYTRCAQTTPCLGDCVLPSHTYISSWEFPVGLAAGSFSGNSQGT